jgi:hypothetical protein
MTDRLHSCKESPDGKHTKPKCVYCEKNITYADYRVQFCGESPSTMHETTKLDEPTEKAKLIEQALHSLDFDAGENH